MSTDDPKDYNPYVNPKKIDCFVKWATIAWIYVSVMAAIMRGGEMTLWDGLGFVVGISTAFGYWLKFSLRRIVVELMFAVIVLLLLSMATLLLPRGLVYFGII